MLLSCFRKRMSVRRLDDNLGRARAAKASADAVAAGAGGSSKGKKKGWNVADYEVTDRSVLVMLCFVLLKIKRWSFDRRRPDLGASRIWCKFSLIVDWGSEHGKFSNSTLNWPAWYW